MSADRYTRILLTIIAASLVYLCAAGTWIGVPAHAQYKEPGPTGPAQVVVVGWRMPANEPVPVVVRGTVVTEPARDSITRVLITGGERTGQPVRVELVGTDEQSRGSWRYSVPVRTDPARPLPAIR